jgi:aminoglycoside phosphotransferase (APT) family kinase protein
MIAPQDVVPYLLARGLLGPEAVVDGGVRVVDASRRNHVWQAVCETGPSFVIKQGRTPEGAATLAREAAVYALLGGVEALRPCLPACHGYDAEAGVLVLEHVPGARDLERYHAALGRFPAGVAAALGEAVGRLHGLSLPDGAGGADRGAAWPLSLHRPGVEAFEMVSAGCLDLIRLLQRDPRYGAGLDALRSEWRADALVHADLRWENVLVADGQTSRRADEQTGRRADEQTSRRADGQGADGATRHAKSVRLIDWEMAGPGDAAWDVASLFAGYLRFWVMGMPFRPDLPPERLPEVARYPLAGMQPALRSLWQAYARARRFTPGEAQAALLRATRYTAGRLVETAYSQLQHATALSNHAALLLQLGFNVLERPQEAAVHLLGMRLHAAAPA